MLQADHQFSSPPRRAPADPAICYYTSGTTKNPKAVLHGHGYTYAHRFTGSLWLDLKPNDLHWTTSDTGWAKAAYGVLFGPWMNGNTVFMYNGHFDPAKEFELLSRYRITNFCAPPTEYRMLVKANLERDQAARLASLRERGRAAESRGDRDLARAFQAADSRWLRPDRDPARRGQPARDENQARRDGPAVSGHRRARARR